MVIGASGVPARTVVSRFRYTPGARLILVPGVAFSRPAWIVRRGGPGPPSFASEPAGSTCSTRVGRGGGVAAGGADGADGGAAGATAVGVGGRPSAPTSTTPSTPAVSAA